jgi:hypothetical protein
MPILLLSACVGFLAAQDPPRPAEISPAKLFAKCDSEIPWFTDGSTLAELETRGRPGGYEHDRDPYLDRAMKQAAERKRLILWY